MALKSFIIKTLRDWCMRHNQHFMVFHGALHRLYTVDRGDVTPIYPTPYQRLIGPSQVGAVKSMGNFEAQTPLLDTQKNISISKKKINWSNNYSLWHLHLNITFSLTTILQQIKETSCEGREVNQVIKRERERCIINNNNTNFTRKIKSSLFVTECRSRYSSWRQIPLLDTPN